MITVSGPYTTGIAPEVGGEVSITVDDWGYWSVWLEVENYGSDYDTADTALQPSESLSLARRLVVAAIVCQWKRIQERFRRAS